MSWKKSRSLDRIQARWKQRDCDITVSRLTKLMDLENLTLRQSRVITGAHIYVSVARSGGLGALDSDDDARSALRRLAIWQDEYAKIAAAFEIPVIAFQGARAHSLAYRPIADRCALAQRAVLFTRAVGIMTAKAFNPAVDDADRLSTCAGADLGDTVGTRGGTKGDSELLFLGTAANRAAKLISTSRLVADDRLVEALPDSLPIETIEAAAEGAQIVRLSDDATMEAIEAMKIDWKGETSKKRIDEALEKWPIDRFKVSNATQLIDLAPLGRSNSKYVDAAVLIADIDGFSDYIADTESDEEKRDAIIALDIIRHELREVLVNDFNGVRIQYQGDNIIGLVHLPAGDATAMAKQALDVAAGMQASMTHTLPEVVEAAKELDVTVGVSTAPTVVSQLGGYARRNAIVVGAAPTEADNISRRLDARQIGVDSATYNSLDDATKGLLEWSKTAKAYVATDLSSDKVTLAREAAASYGSERRLTPSPSGVTAITPAVGAPPTGSTDVRPLRPYSRPRPR